jgi:hypothetical protein
MKKLLFVLPFAALFFLFQSCEDALNFDFDAVFSSNLNIDITETKSDQFPFSATDTLNIEDDEEIQKHYNKIKSLEITRIECRLTGIPEGQTIQELNVKVEGTVFLVALTDLTENHTFDVEVENEMLDILANYLFENPQTVITVYGNSSYAPMTLGVKLTYHSKVTAGL